MGTTYHTPQACPAGRSVFLATAAYEAVKPGFAYSLALTAADLTRHHIPFELAIMEGNCHVDDGRNSLVRQFLEGNCTDMLFLDSDLMWSSRDVIKILAHKDDLVCGAYPKKCSPAKYPIGQIVHTRHDGMLEVSFAPTGFMRIRRSVFEKLLPSQSKHGKQRPTAVFFERRFNGSTRDGGDVTFCRKWISAGGKVVVDPFMQFSHIGEHPWSGSFIDYLGKDEHRQIHLSSQADGSKEGKLVDPARTYNSEVGETVRYWIDRIRDGNADLDSFSGLVHAYGNESFAASPELLKIAYEMAHSLPDAAKVLECGSGLTTVVLAAAGVKVIALEEHAEWADKTAAALEQCGLDARVIVCPMNGVWFDRPEKIEELAEGAEMILIDGPRRRAGMDRMYPLATYIVKSGTAVLADDVLAIEETGTWCSFPGERPFVAGRLG